MNNKENETIEKLNKLAAMTMHQKRHSGNSSHRGQGRILAILKMKPTISQKELGYLLDMSKQALAELLSKMEKKGYIQRTPSQEDKRILLIELSDEGMKSANDLSHNNDELSSLLNDFSEEEIDGLNTYLDKLLQNMETAFPDLHSKEKQMAREQFMREHGHGRHGHRHGHDHHHGAGHHSKERRAQNCECRRGEQRHNDKEE